MTLYETALEYAPAAAVWTQLAITLTTIALATRWYVDRGRWRAAAQAYARLVSQARVPALTRVLGPEHLAPPDEDTQRVLRLRAGWREG